MSQLINNKGFTLLESLLSLFITSLSIFLISLSIQQINELMALPQANGQYEWHLFLHQVENDRMGGPILEVNPKSFAFMAETGSGIQKTWYEFYRNQEGGQIRRRPRSGGHMPMLMDLKDARVEEFETYFIFHVTFDTGESYSARIEKEHPKDET